MVPPVSRPASSLAVFVVVAMVLVVLAVLVVLVTVVLVVVVVVVWWSLSCCGPGMFRALCDELRWNWCLLVKSFAQV